MPWSRSIVEDAQDWSSFETWSEQLTREPVWYARAHNEVSPMQQQALQFAPSTVPSPLTRGFARLEALSKTGFYAALSTMATRLALPSSEENLDFVTAARDAYELHERMLTRPGMRDVLRRVEREDLATLPFFLALSPGDVRRVHAKRARNVRRLAVEPPDDFPYPEYYLNDFHNQSNGNLSLRAALTYEWQIRFLFMGTHHLMRQGVIDEIPEGDGLDVLDVACGTASWLTQARLQNRRHPVTGIDLSPHYLKVARFFRGRDATFLQMNAEQLSPGWTGRFDVVTNIWLFHELPQDALDRATAEMARVLKPSGKLIFMEAIQLADAPPRRRLEKANERFLEIFNEPYFASYQRLDLPRHFARFGLEVASVSRWNSSKVITAYKR